MTTGENMADLHLIETARAQDDADFRWRVAAACFHMATGFASMPVGIEQNYAIFQLLNPQHADPSMVAMVAAWEPVSTAITVQDGAVDTSAVTDSDITDAVAQAWALVSNKYPTNPLAAGGA